MEILISIVKLNNSPFFLKFIKINKFQSYYCLGYDDIYKYRITAIGGH